jgi:hypothetical protein
MGAGPVTKMVMAGAEVLKTQGIGGKKSVKVCQITSLLSAGLAGTRPEK